MFSSDKKRHDTRGAFTVRDRSVVVLCVLVTLALLQVLTIGLFLTTQRGAHGDSLERGFCTEQKFLAPDTPRYFDNECEYAPIRLDVKKETV